MLPVNFLTGLLVSLISLVTPLAGPSSIFSYTILFKTDFSYILNLVAFLTHFHVFFSDRRSLHYWPFKSFTGLPERVASGIVLNY